MEEPKLIAFSEDGLRAIQEHIENLRVDLGASGAMLLERSGQLLIECGQRGDFDINTFLALLGNAMSAANAVVHLLQDEAGFDLHFHEGRNLAMYTARISDQVFLTLILERHTGSASRAGMIWLSLRHAVTELRTLLNSAVVAPGTAEGEEIKSAVSDTLDEALNLIENDILLPVKPASDSSKNASDQALNIAEPPPAPPKSPSEVPKDSEHLLSYEEARARGLINLDDSKTG